MTDKTDIAALREAALKVTPGKWKLGIGSTYAYVQAAIDMKLGGSSWVKLCHLGRAGWRNQQSTIDDARFIALANPATIIAILEQLEVVSKSEWKLAGELTELQMNYNALQKKDNSSTLGVGEGSGRLFVHGDYDSIKATQKIILERDALKAKLANPVVLRDCSFEAVSHMAHWYSEGECVAWVSGAEHVKKQILAAGFPVREE